MSTRPSIRERAAWAGLVFVALVLRLAALGHRAMSHDESLHALYSHYLANGLNYSHDPMMHGPLLFHLNGLLLALVPATDFVSRLVPALLGVGCVALLFLYRRWLGPRGAWSAAALVAVEPALLFYSRYMRNDIYIAFFTLLMVWAIFRYREERRPAHLLWLTAGLALSFVCKEVCFIHGAVLGSACVGFAALDAFRSRAAFLRNWMQHPFTECAALMLTIALPFAAAVVLPYLDWDPLDNRTLAGQARIGGMALVFFGIGSAAAIPYFHHRDRLRTWGAALGIFWTVQLLFYTTLFTNVRHGLTSGLAGSLGYWLDQHDVQRGNDDPFFYVTLVVLYAPVLLVGLAWGLRNIRHRPEAFLLWWTLGNLAVYSWAGERMPWLVLHITLPLCLLTGAALPRIFDARPRGILKGALQTAVALGLLQLTVNSLRANGPNAEGAQEPLVYAHTGPKFKTAMDLIEAHLAAHPGTRVRIHKDFSWPTAWYTRDIDAGYGPIKAGEEKPDTSAILVPPHRKDAFLSEGWVPRLEVDMTTWPRPHYHRFTRENLINVFTRPDVRKKLIRYVLFRDQPPFRPGEYPGPNRFLLMTRNPPPPSEE